MKISNNKYIVKKNSRGYGVYAGNNYKKNEDISVITGKIATPKNIYYHLKDFQKASTNPLQIGKGLYIDVDRPFLYINHSCDPNAGIKKKSTLFAIKNIKKGDEITFDYSTTIDESFECKCGSKKCRGAIVDFFGLSKKLQKYYADKKALPNFILKKYKKH